LSQYPTTKKIGDQEVVIMTVQQGKDINQEFTRLKDSLNWFRRELLTKSLAHKSAMDTLAQRSQDLRYQRGETRWYKDEYYSLQKDVVTQIKHNNRDMDVMLGLVAVLTAVITIFSSRF